jgi:phage terminase Nu1 subunit (DNA packaging protein)
MTDVFHHYVGKDGKRPKPSAEQKDQQGARAELVRAQTRERVAKATLAEMEARKRTGELIDRATAMRQASFLFVTIRQRLLALPAQLARRLEVPDKHQARMIIDSAIREALTELAELPDVITREQYEDFVEENDEKQSSEPRGRKASR